MSINIKKYTKDQMAKMVEEAQSAQKEAEATAATYFEWAKQLREQISKMETQERSLRAKNAALTEQIDQMNGEAINKANEIANLKADLDASKAASKLLNDQGQGYWRAWQASKREVTDLKTTLADTEAALRRANALCEQLQSNLTLTSEACADYAEAHPWCNLWAWVKRKMVRHE